MRAILSALILLFASTLVRAAPPAHASDAMQLIPAGHFLMGSPLTFGPLRDDKLRVDGVVQIYGTML
jgi:hypothetical protein